MKLIYRTSSTEFVNAVRVGLDREGIGHYIPEAAPATFGLGGHLMVGHSVFLLDEADEEHAMAVLAELGAFDRPTRSAASDSAGRTFPRWVLFLAAMGVALLIGALFTH